MKESIYLPTKHKKAWYANNTSSTTATSNSLKSSYNNNISSTSSSTSKPQKFHNIPSTMPCWYYDKDSLLQTPSIMEGITLENERRYRKEGARFILECGTKMGLGINTIATGVVYFHRFYMFHSFKSFPRYVTACCCLFLAGKVEETPKKCRDIIRTARTIISDDHFYSFGDDPKEEVMTLERILLQTIKFDLQVEHPHTYLLKYAKCFKGDQQKLQKIVQMAWNFVNDSMSTVVCLQWEPEIIAVALIYLASKLGKFTVVDWVGRQPHHTRWWDMFVGDVTMEILDNICHQVLDLYQTNSKEPQVTNSPPQRPQSRADSPPLTLRSGLPLSQHSGSPTGKTRRMPLDKSNAYPIQSLTNSSGYLPTMSVDGQGGSAIPSTASGATNYHHLFHAPPPPVANHHMHHGGGSMYGGGGNGSSSNSGGNSVVPPPPPPHAAAAYGNVIAPPPMPPPTLSSMPPYGGPPPNSWGPPPPTHHYGNAPPPLPPNANLPPPPQHSNQQNNSSSGYYSSSSSSNSYAGGRHSRY